MEIINEQLQSINSNKVNQNQIPNDTEIKKTKKSPECRVEHLKA